MSIVIIYIFLGVWGQVQMGYIQTKLHSIVLFKKTMNNRVCPDWICIISEVLRGPDAKFEYCYISFLTKQKSRLYVANIPV